MSRRTAAPAVGAALLALGLSGCAAGQRAQTYQERTAIDGTNTAVGSLAIRDMYVQAPTTGLSYGQGADAPVHIILVNKGAQGDVLTGASSPIATSVQVSGPSPTLTVPGLQAQSAYSLVLSGLTRELRTADYINLTMSFQVNGSHTFLVPVQLANRSQPKTATPPPAGNTQG